MNLKILVTGGTGFIGRHLLHRLQTSGRHAVAALVRSQSTLAPPHLSSLPNSILPIQGSLADPDWPSIRAFAPDVVVHTAWITTPGIYLESPENELHRDWSLAFLSTLATLGVRRFVVIGTCIEYAPSPDPLIEDVSPLAPATRYAQCKQALHQALMPVFQRHGASWIWARLFHPYGEGEHPQRLCSALIHSLQRYQPLTLKTPYSAKDYIHVSDVARALELFCESNFCGAVNIGSGTAVTVATIAQTIARLLGRPPLAFPTPPPPNAPADRTLADIHRLSSLGWSPHVSLETGLQQLIQHLA